MNAPLTYGSLTAESTIIAARDVGTVLGFVSQDDRRFWAPFGGCRVTSHFQPIVSPSHRRVIGHEGLVRATNAAGEPVSPFHLIAAAAQRDELQLLDRICCSLHIANHSLSPSQDDWLFLNMHPDVFVRARETAILDYLLAIMGRYGYDPRRIVIEVLEQAITDNVQFSEIVEYLRSMGCLVALDDFGAGHSNFDRVWRIRPEIVKLDRSYPSQAAHDPRARRLLPQIVSLLHEAGSIVLIEGVETEEQALIALEADVDLIQGYHFARPAPDPVQPDALKPSLTRLWERFACENRELEPAYESLQPYLNHLSQAADLLAEGQTMEQACAGFLGLERANTCYLLDSSGVQISSTLRRPGARNGTRFSTMGAVVGTNWSRRGYFRRALANLNHVQYSRPYLSLDSGELCKTVSIAFVSHGHCYVLCGDMSWS